MSENILEVHDLSKIYKEYTTPWNRFFSWFNISSNSISEKKVLDNVNFNIAAGEAVGIVGHNGAGKSTLLKIITGTLKLTQGRVIKKGRIAAILELGMGFHPDLTGRQNVYHSAGLMGFSKEQIDNVIEQIEEFAEIGSYFDLPVRTYSSGMQVRVAFSVATAYRPDILIVDEALSVGDAYFQHKSFNKIKEFQKEGTTMILVSHDRNAIQAICQRAILFENGKIIQDGDPESVMDYYNALIAEKEGSTIKQLELESGKTQTISGTGEATIEEVKLFDSSGEEIETVGVGDDISLQVKIKVHEEIPSLVLGYSIKDRLGQVLFGTNTWHSKQVIESPKKDKEYIFDIKFQAIFGVGSYSVQLALVDKDTHLTENYEWRDLALVFDVVNIDKQFFVGSLWNEPIIKIEEK